jgi:hypothetical protein
MVYSLNVPAGHFLSGIGRCRKKAPGLKSCRDQKDVAAGQLKTKLKNQK